MNSCELVTFISSLACAISQCCDKDELPQLSSIFTLLGAAIDTIVNHDELCQSKKEGSNDSFPQQDQPASPPFPPRQV